MAEQDKELDLDIDDGGGKSNSKLILIVVVVMLLIAIGGGAFFFLTQTGSDPAIDDETGEEISEPVLKQQAIYIPMKPAFVVNFATTGSQNFLQLEVTLMTRDPAVAQAVETNLPLIRNDLITLFSSQTYDILMTQDGKQKLREAALSEVQKTLQSEYGDAGVEQVLFTSFVIQ